MNVLSITLTQTEKLTLPGAKEDQEIHTQRFPAIGPQRQEDITSCPGVAAYHLVFYWGRSLMLSIVPNAFRTGSADFRLAGVIDIMLCCNWIFW